MDKFFKNSLAKFRTTLHSLYPSIFKKAQQLQFKLLTSDNKKIAKIGNKIELPKNDYPLIEQYLQMFYNSVSQNGRANGQNLLFVIGMQRTGKSSLIQQSLLQFRKRKSVYTHSRKKSSELEFTTLSSPQYLQDLEKTQKLSNQFSMILQFDFKEHTMMKSEAFFHLFESTIKQKLLDLTSEIKLKTNKQLLNVDILLAIATADHLPEYLYMFVKDYVWAVLNDCEIVKVGEKAKKQLQVLLNQISDTNAHQFFNTASLPIYSTIPNLQSTQIDPQIISAFHNRSSNSNQSYFQRIVKILSLETKTSELETTLNMLIGVYRRIQYEHRPSQLYKNRQYITGIQTCKLLFSILNHICGFGKLNQMILKQFVEEKIDRNTKQKSSTSIVPSKLTSYILQGNHIDTVLSLRNLSNLSCFNHPKFQNFLDSILIQTHNQTNLRTHFPIIIQLNDCYLLRNLQNCGRLEIDNPSVLEIPQYYQTNIYRYIPRLIFKENIVELLRKALGRNITVWNQAIMEMAKGVPMEKIISGQCEFMTSTKNRLQNRLTRLWLNPQNLPLIDNKTLELHILQYLLILKKCRGNLRTTFQHINAQILYNPQFSQLYSANIVFESYYFPAVSLTDMRDLLHIKNMLSFKQLGLKKWIQFLMWRKLYSPYYYSLRDFRYLDKNQVQMYKRLGPNNMMSDYMIREYYGEHRDYRISLYRDVLKINYNL